MKNLTTTTGSPKLFLTDYKSYNEGKQFEHGHWIDLTDFNDADELQEYISQHFEDAGIEDPEPMYTDFENFPKYLYSESMSSEDMERLYKYINIGWEDMSYNDKVNAWNEYCSENNPDDELFDFDDEFFNIFFEGKPMEAARAATFGDINWGHDYIYFNGYGNLETTSDPSSVIDEDVLLQWLIDNQ